MAVRSVKRLVKAKPTLEGAGVPLRRAFGFGATSDYDPFLLLDDFRNERPEAYLPGFSWHPHRGIETITYVLAGTVEHGDSMGNRGSIGVGDIQWMTAGRGRAIDLDDDVSAQEHPSSKQMEFLTGTGCDQHLLCSGEGAGSRVPMAQLGCRCPRVPRLVFGSPQWNTPSDERRTTPRRPERTSTTILQEEV
jgi:hypothetical protein